MDSWVRKVDRKYHYAGDQWVSRGRVLCGELITAAAYTVPDECMAEWMERPQSNKGVVCKRCLRVKNDMVAKKS